MLNTASLDVVQAAHFSQRFMRPCYDSYCFSHLPATIEFLLIGEDQGALPPQAFGDLPTRYEKVIFFFIDGFGWRFFSHYAEQHAFLKEVMARGAISKMTAQFPSTTAAHATCAHTGLDVGQSGVYEWNYYEPLVDAVISPLLFAYAGEARDSLLQAGPPPEDFFPPRTFYQRLQSRGVIPHIFQYQAYTPSTYSNTVFRGAEVHPYGSFQEMLVLLSEMVKLPPPQPTYYFIYFDRIDLLCHRYGPLASQVDDQIETFLNMMDELFYKEVQGQAGRTLCVLSADHGHVEVDPKTTIYLDMQLPAIRRSLKTNRRGQPLVPAGSARDMFLYVKEEILDEAVAQLQQLLAGRAEVYRTRDFLQQHFFGLHQPSPTFLGRLGNVVILPYKNETVWWYGDGRFAMNFYGHHGGLTPEEMEIPLMLLPL